VPEGRFAAPLSDPPALPRSPSHSEAEHVFRPVLKWAGSKQRLTTEILGRLPAEIDTYYEPFVGSAAVFIALAAGNRFKKAVLSDRNAELVNVYKTLQRNVDALIQHLARHKKKHDEEYFYKVRAQLPGDLDNVQRAARTIYLNQTGFNGLYRVNRSGQFNVPFGRYKNPGICNEPRLRGAAWLLKSVKIQEADFEEACSGASKGDAVYFDPPYVPLSPTSFVAYHHQAFDDAEHERLGGVFATLATRAVSVVLSNSDTPRTRELYRRWTIDPIQVPRLINSKSDQRGTVGELLVTARRK
jgi:DNA adenine methylase